MALQPDNCSEDLTENSFIDFDQYLFSPNGFRDQYGDLALSQDDGLLTTPELERANPFAPSIEGFHIDPSDKLPISSEGTNVENALSISDAEASGSNVDNYSNPQVDANEQIAIATIANDLRNSLDKFTDEMEVKAVLTVISRNRASIRMGNQPITRQRFRYRDNVIRYLKGSRCNPMSVELLGLIGCLTLPHQSFWIRAVIVTTQNNPDGKVYLHQHELFYNGENAQQNGLHSFLIPLTDEDIRRGIKIFPHLAVIKTKQGNYSFELIPFDPLMPDDHMTYYTPPDENIPKVQQSKCFDEAYHTDEFRIAFQLLINQKDQWYITDLSCVTHVVTNTGH